LAELEVVEVKSGRDMREFLNLPERIYGNDPNWIPPLKSDVRHLLNQQKHPFWEFSKGQAFIAREKGTTVGRVVGIIDSNHNQRHRERVAAWGFYECMDNREAALSLFEAVERWGARNGMDFMRGPLNPSVNYDVGTLVENFDDPPTLFMPYNPPFYGPLIEAAGFQTEKNLFSYRIDRNLRTPSWIAEFIQRLRRRISIRIRHADMKNFRRDVLLIKDLYNAAWAKNWANVPVTENEAIEMGKRMKPIVDPEVIIFIYDGDEPIGIGFALPDWNPVLKKLNGRIGIRGLPTLLRRKKLIKGLRGFIFGIREEYQQQGIPFLAYEYMERLLRQGSRYDYMELGWLLEESPMHQFLAEGGIGYFKKYRIYRKEIRPGQLGYQGKNRTF